MDVRAGEFQLMAWPCHAQRCGIIAVKLDCAGDDSRGSHCRARVFNCMWGFNSTSTLSSAVYGWWYWAGDLETISSIISAQLNTSPSLLSVLRHSESSSGTRSGSDRGPRDSEVLVWEEGRTFISPCSTKLLQEVGPLAVDSGFFGFSSGTRRTRLCCDSLPSGTAEAAAHRSKHGEHLRLLGRCGSVLRSCGCGLSEVQLHASEATPAFDDCFFSHCCRRNPHLFPGLSSSALLVLPVCLDDGCLDLL